MAIIRLSRTPFLAAPLLCGVVLLAGCQPDEKPKEPQPEEIVEVVPEPPSEESATDEQPSQASDRSEEPINVELPPGYAGSTAKPKHEFGTGQVQYSPTEPDKDILEQFIDSEKNQPSESTPGETPGEAGPKPVEDDEFDLSSIDYTPPTEEEFAAELAKREAERLERRKKVIASLGQPLVDNVDKLKKLDKLSPVWLDMENKRVVMLGQVAQRESFLEMFACLVDTKEHESVVAVDTKAFIVHAALLALGAKVGNPVQFRPTYVPADGQEIEVTVVWKDKEGKVQTARAQEWVRNTKTGKQMEENWVFAGAGFWTDERTGEKHYTAEGGDFICVSNFPTAMLDVPIESTGVDQDLLFETFTERIPERETPVTLILTPKVKKKEVDESSPASE